jgi:ATP-binding cassette subfamily F protein uup
MSDLLLFLKNAEVTFGGQPLFSKLSLQLSKRDRVCLVGKNGAGKSSLIKIITKELQLDHGELYIRPGMQIGYLSQETKFQPYESIYDYITRNIRLSEDEQLEDKLYLADSILSALDLTGSRIMSQLSGGELRRVALSRALISNPDLLLLDEPTNHLDINCIIWLENYLKSYQGGLIVISHDRLFLNNISNKLFWLDRGTLRIHNKGFKDFENWSENILSLEVAALNRLGKKLIKENIWLQQGVTARRKRNQGRLKELFELRTQLKENTKSLATSNARINAPSLEQAGHSKVALEIEHLSYSTPQANIISNFSLRMMQGEHIGIIGKNGIGKTTLVKLILGELTPTSGRVKLAKTTKVSYFDQQKTAIDPALTLMQAIGTNGADMVMVGGVQIHAVTYLKDFLFDSTRLYSPVSSLSGGELNRLLLAKLLADPGNVLILDEPTNDLDMDSLDLLQEVLANYPGNLIIISHDRDFLDRTISKLIVFEGDGELQTYIGGYSDTQAQRAEAKRNEAKPTEAKLAEARPTEAKLECKTKPSKTPKLSYLQNRELEALPKQMDDLQAEIHSIDQALLDPDLYNKDITLFNRLVAELAQKTTRLGELEHRWLELT